MYLLSCEWFMMPFSVWFKSVCFCCQAACKDSLMLNVWFILCMSNFDLLFFWTYQPYFLLSKAFLCPAFIYWQFKTAAALQLLKSAYRDLKMWHWCPVTSLVLFLLFDTRTFFSFGVVYLNHFEPLQRWMDAAQRGENFVFQKGHFRSWHAFE